MYVCVGLSLFHRCCYGGKEDVREGGVTVGRGGQLHHRHWSLLTQSLLWTLHLPFRQTDGMTSISQAINVRVTYILILQVCIGSWSGIWTDIPPFLFTGSSGMELSPEIGHKVQKH